MPEAAAGDSIRREQVGVRLRRLPVGWQLPPLPAALPAAAVEPSASERELVEFDWARETARHIGVVAHALLKRLGDEGTREWTPQRVARERIRVTRALAALGLTGSEVDTAVEQVLAAIDATLRDPRGQWLFAPSHRDARSEYALTGVREGAVVHQVLDRTFVDADGVRWIVDFKLSRHEGASAGAFLDREQDRYRAQLEGYARIMREIDPRPIRVGIYFPLVPGWREWNPSP